jgi:[acyl-carrier-protein] S-malonyltransferase
MQEAVALGAGAMAAVLGGEQSAIESVCAEASENQVCAIANINSQNQVVIAGNAEAVDRAMVLMKDAGAKRVIKLNVSAPFHCKLMKPAQEQLALELDELVFTKLRIPLVTNVDAKVETDPAILRDALFRQVVAPVRWLESMELLIKEGVEKFVEVGPGKVLSGLTRQISRNVSCANVEDAASLQATCAALTA